MCRHGKQWTESQDVSADHCRHGACQRHGDQAPRLPFKKQQLHREQHRRDRGSKRRRHASCRSRHQQRFALSSSQVKKLRNHRPECAARHDDWPFRTKRTAGTNGDCRGKRLQKRDLWLHSASIHQNRFDCFRNPMPTDSLGAITRHHANDQRPANGDQHAEYSQVIPCRRHHRRTPSAKIEKVCEQPNQPQQHQRNKCAQHPDNHRQ